MTSFGPDFSQLYPAVKTTPNPGIHNQDGPSGTTNPGSLPATSDQQKQAGRVISGGVMRDAAVALGNAVPSTGDVYDDAFQALSEYGDGVQGDLTLVLGEVQQVKFGLITLADLASTRRRVPYWVSPNPFEYVSFPRSMLNLDNGSKPVFTIPAGTLALGAVSIEEATTNNQVRFIAGGNTPPTHVYVGLWRVNQANGDLIPVYDFGDVVSEIDTGSETYEVALEMSTDMLIDAGEIMVVGILPVGGSFTVGAVPRQQIVPTPVIYPQAATELLSGLTALPGTTIADSALDHTSTHRILVAVGQALPETIAPVYGTINFGTNVVDWGSPSCVNLESIPDAYWEVFSGVLTAYGVPSFFALTYDLGFIVKQKCATNDMFAEFVVGSGWTTFATMPSRVYVHCANDGSAAVGLFVAQNGAGNATVTIKTVTSLATQTGTTRATGTDVFSAAIGDVFRIEAETDDVSGHVTYTGFRNGVPITDCSWTDTGSVAPTGVAWRRAGYGSSMFTNLNVRYPAAGADAFRYGDLSAMA